MSESDEIPEDIREKADRLVGLMIERFDLGEDAIARAILAERDRDDIIADLVGALEAVRRHGELACVDAGGSLWGSSGKKPPSKDVWQFPRHILVDIDAAIEKAARSHIVHGDER